MEIYDDIIQYLPQKTPFVMVDKLISVTDNTTTTNLTIKTGNLFAENGKFYEGGMIENIAQTVAAGAGYRERQKNEGPLVGMIGAVKRLVINRRPKVGDTLRTEVTLITEFENAMVIEGSIFNENEKVAQCQMNIFIIKSADQKK